MTPQSLIDLKQKIWVNKQCLLPIDSNSGYNSQCMGPYCTCARNCSSSYTESSCYGACREGCSSTRTGGCTILARIITLVTALALVPVAVLMAAREYIVSYQNDYTDSCKRCGSGCSINCGSNNCKGGYGGKRTCIDTNCVDVNSSHTANVRLERKI